MKILFFGDIVGKIGRKGLIAVLPELKKKYQPDFTLANAENIAHGTGATRKTLIEVAGAGLDCFTSGNHIWDKKETQEILSLNDIVLLRPANYPPGVAGKGLAIISNKAGKKLLVINLLGRVFFREILDCPFRKLDELLNLYTPTQYDAAIIDFHAEATSEKNALGLYADGRVGAVLGTHTHIMTADNQILPSGTAYITDIGMVGAKHSIIGVEKKGPLQQFLTQQPGGFEIPEHGHCVVNGVFLEIDEITKKAKNIERIWEEVMV